MGLRLMRNTALKIKIALIVLVFVLATIFLLDFKEAYASKKVCLGGGGGISVVSPICGDKSKRASYKAKIRNGKAIPPVIAPKRVKKVIRAGNKIRNKPYVYGGGHGSFKSNGYDCSGSVSFALKGGNFVKAPMASGPYMSWGKSGKGKWITVYTHEGHAYLEVAGIRLDTSGTGGTGPSWHKTKGDRSGFLARYPKGY